MSRKVAILFLIACINVALFVPLFSAQAAIVPQCPDTGCRACDLVKLGNNVIQFLLLISAFVAALILAIAGIQTVISGESSELKHAAVNIVIGIIIMLLCWLTVDLVMKVMTGGSLGPWNSIPCVENAHVNKLAEKAVTPVQVLPGGNGTGGGTGSGTGTQGTGGTGGAGGGNLQQCPPENTACSVEALKAAGMTDEQANVMSCIAMTESSGNANAQSNTSSACGTFQIIRGTWSSSASGGCSDFSNCNNAQCNAQAAASLVSKNGYRDWTCSGCNSKAQQCINQYGGGNASILRSPYLAYSLYE